MFPYCNIFQEFCHTPLFKYQNSLSASHASSSRTCLQVLLHNPRQNIPSGLLTIHCFSPSVCFMCFFILSRWSMHAHWPWSVSILWQIWRTFHPHQAKHTQTLTPSNVLLCVTFLKSSSCICQVKHIHNIHHLQFQCQDPLQWCVHSLPIKRHSLGCHHTVVEFSDMPAVLLRPSNVKPSW